MRRGGPLRWSVLTGLIACAGPPADSAVVDPPTEAFSLEGPCDAAVDLGGFAVYSDANGSVVSGAVLDGVIPLTVRTPIASSGGCRLLRQENPFCDPPCVPGETCDLKGTCVPFPVEQDLGMVTLEGLTTEVVMAPNSPGYSYYDLGLEHPPYAPGALVRLSTTGGALPSLVLDGVGLDPLPPSDAVLGLEAGRDLILQWEPPTTTDSTIHLRVAIDQHGNTPVLLECELDDDGEGRIDGALVQQFVDSGVTGRPRASLERRTVDSVDVAGGCVELEVVWSTTRAIDVVGYTPCLSQEECPPGETCNEGLEICE